MALSKKEIRRMVKDFVEKIDWRRYIGGYMKILREYDRGGGNSGIPPTGSGDIG